ncbi:MAG: response regulator transcription factor, partial [Chloroflexota bacterium]
LEIGIDGYVYKEVEPSELKGVIRAVMRGEAFLEPLVTQVAIKKLSDQHREPPNFIKLTNREFEVLGWMATPNTYREIAVELNISEETIRSHAKSILNKLGQKNRAQAVLFALQAKIIEL